MSQTQNPAPEQESASMQAYAELVVKSGLADYSPVRGCMIIKPYGFALWECMQQILDHKFKETGHQNVYFPLFIPKHFFSKEAAHVEGFAKECAVVTHYRLKNDEQTGEIVVDEEARLEEELIVRPTSETIIWNTYKDWVQSYRDLPLLFNQWANVVRWEMRTRLFLRTSEFLWQEGHTAHATREEAIKEAERMLQVYVDFVEQYMAVAVVQGIKSPSERFAGAEETYCIEAMLLDGKALQAGTSHFLGQNFAKAFDVSFMDSDNERKFVWATSWGVSTRLIGALILSHHDTRGLRLPPRIAPVQVVVIPLGKMSDVQRDYIDNLLRVLREKHIRVRYDDDTQRRPGWKFAQYELQGVPLRISIGAREVAEESLEVVRRDTGEKILISIEEATTKIESLLDSIQLSMLAESRTHLSEQTRKANDVDTLQKILDEHGGFVSAHWDGTAETEQKIKELTKATIRCIPLHGKQEAGKCILTGKPSSQRVLFARAY